MTKLADKVFVIPTSLDSAFFTAWLEFSKPLHKLSSTEIRVLAEFLRIRHELSSKILDEELLNKNTFSNENKNLIKEICGLKTAHYQAIMTGLRKKGILKENNIHPKLLPVIQEDANSFNLMIMFKFNG